MTDVQKNYYEMILQAYEKSYDDIYDLANLRVALLKHVDNIKKLAQTHYDQGTIMRAFDYAEKGWTEPSLYDRWVMGIINHKLGEFQTKLFELYKVGSESNQEILRNAYPDFFKSIKLEL